MPAGPLRPNEPEGLRRPFGPGRAMERTFAGRTVICGVTPRVPPSYQRLARGFNGRFQNAQFRICRREMPRRGSFVRHPWPPLDAAHRRSLHAAEAHWLAIRNSLSGTRHCSPAFSHEMYAVKRWRAQMDREHIRAVAEKAKGAVKETAGKVIGDESQRQSRQGKGRVA